MFSEKIKAWVKHRQERWKLLSGADKWGLVLLLMVAVVDFSITWSVRTLPEYIPNTTITTITQSYLLVGLTLLLLTTQIHVRDLKNWSVGLSLLSVLLSLLSLIASSIGTGFKILSTNVVTYDFAVATLLLLLAIEFTAMGLLLPKLEHLSNKNRISGDYWKKYIK